MGRYIDKGNMGFREARKGEYVDKSGMISVINETLCSEFKYSCVSRARRFGKSMAAKMLCAYYDRSCDSHALFDDLAIARDPSYEEHLNKYPVIYLDVTDFTTRNIPREDLPIVMQQKVKEEVCESFPDVMVKADDDLMDVLGRVVRHTGVQFIMIIDEWDAICREAANTPEAMDRYVNLLRRLFKGGDSATVFAGAYMTGILPIKKYDTQSALNNFREYSVVDPGNLAQYFGFTPFEVKVLAERRGMDYSELEKWYDGYKIGDEQSIFNPNSVVQALMRHRCRSYWAKTGAYDSVAVYIKMNFEGLKDDVIRMIAGGRVKVRTSKFQNDMHKVSSRDDVLTVLIHLGYLTYDWDAEECYIPNREVADEMVNAVEENNWKPVVDALETSERLLAALLRGDAEAVAHGVETAHRENTSLFKYSDENAMACVLSLAFYNARNDFHIHREYQTGDGYADLVLIPRKNVSKPAVVIELKYNHTTDTAISQIKQKHYPEKVQEYMDDLNRAKPRTPDADILLVGISYDKETKVHTCQIEKYLN